MVSRYRAIGMLEAFSLVHEVGEYVLTKEEIRFMRTCESKKGCPLERSKLTSDDRLRIIRLGQQCKMWKEQNR